MKLPSLRLKPHEDRRLRAGHLWIYSNEIDIRHSPLAGFEPGALCRVEDARGNALGIATINPRALLCARLLSSRADLTIDLDWMSSRLRAALSAREAVFSEPFYRLVYGEADGLPGLVVDRYDDVLVAQLATAGMEQLKPLVIEALSSLLSPRGILFRNDVAMREAEALPLYAEAVGEVPDTVEIAEAGVRFQVPLRGGQKTGWFFDQHDNRDRLGRYARGADVLDVFSYVGAWGVRAMAFGAAQVACIDASAQALALAAINGEANGSPIETLHGQALDVMQDLAGQGRRFSLVIVDPPALIKRKKDHAAGLAHYERLNRAALALLQPGGVLVSCSCSFHLDASELQRTVLRASRADGRRLSILEQGGQGPDHPVHPAIPETRYLKALFCRVAHE